MFRICGIGITKILNSHTQNVALNVSVYGPIRHRDEIRYMRVDVVLSFLLAGIRYDFKNKIDMAINAVLGNREHN